MSVHVVAVASQNNTVPAVTGAPLDVAVAVSVIGVPIATVVTAAPFEVIVNEMLELDATATVRVTEAAAVYASPGFDAVIVTVPLAVYVSSDPTIVAGPVTVKLTGYPVPRFEVALNVRVDPALTGLGGCANKIVCGDSITCTVCVTGVAAAVY